MVVPFGFGVGDFVAVGTVAWRLYKSTKEAPESFRNIHIELLSLHAVIKETEETVFKYPVPEERSLRLKAVKDGIDSVLGDLEALIKKYDSLGSKSKGFVWSRMRWGAEDIAEIRARMNTNVSLLGTFICTSQSVVEQKLEKLAAESRRGDREGSVISVQTVDSLMNDQRGDWRMIRKELEEAGVTVAAWELNRDFIVRWIKNALETGALDEQAPATPGASYTGEVDDTPVCSETSLSGLKPDYPERLVRRVTPVLFKATHMLRPPWKGRVADLYFLDCRGGEILDVFSEQGNLWLAAKEDDKANQVGWVWAHLCMKRESINVQHDKSYYHVRQLVNDKLAFWRQTFDDGVDLSDLCAEYSEGKIRLAAPSWSLRIHLGVSGLSSSLNYQLQAKLAENATTPSA